MNWFKLIGNIGGVTSLCFGAHTAMSGGVSAAAGSWQTWFGVGLCLAANLAGLFQNSPHTGE